MARRARASAWRYGVGAALLTAAACNLFNPLGYLQAGAPGADGGDDGVADDGRGVADVAADVAADAYTDADATNGTYMDLLASKNWTTILPATDEGLPYGYGFTAVCAVFDGRYVTFPMSTFFFQNGPLRYDTHERFDVRSAWSVTDLTKLVDAAGAVFTGCARDDARLYLPIVATGGRSEIFYEDLDGGGWVLADLSSSIAPFLARPTSDGIGWLYQPTAWDYSVNKASGLVAKIDGPRLPDASVIPFDTSKVSPFTNQWANALFDARHVYLVPGARGGQHGHVARVSVDADVTDPNQWESFDPDTVVPAAQGFESATYDGRYVYLWGMRAQGPNAFVLRYDTQGMFTGAPSWASVDLRAPGDAGNGAWYFAGATFDGRYMYAVANQSTVNDAGNPLEVTLAIVRYDTTQSFLPGAFEQAPLRDVVTNPKVQWPIALVGAAFDGQFVYFGPGSSPANHENPVVRFFARDPPSLPAAARASFF